MTEALGYLHFSARVIHRGICPQSVIINKRGTWKLAGLEFSEKANEGDLMVSMIIIIIIIIIVRKLLTFMMFLVKRKRADNFVASLHAQLPVASHPYTSKLPKMCQPDLDFVAPEIQSSSACSPQSDMFSLGLLICAIYNNGRSPIESNFSSASYFKQLETVSTKWKYLFLSLSVIDFFFTHTHTNTCRQSVSSEGIKQSLCFCDTLPRINNCTHTEKERET